MSNRLALCEVSGPLTDLLQKLSGENGEEWQRGLTKFLRRENPWATVATGLKVFKTISLGTGPKTVQDFVSALKEQGFKVGDWAKDILGQPMFTIAPRETEIDLVVVSVRDLGLEDGTTTREIYERAQELGLALCPAEVGPQLRLQYHDQPKREWLLVAMDPITDSDGDLNVFHVAHVDEGLWLSAYYGNPDLCWADAFRWVFSRRK